jgi:hypothetical protein
MADTSAARQFVNITPPRAAQLGVPGGPVILSVGPVAGVLALGSIYPQPPPATIVSTVTADSGLASPTTGIGMYAPSSNFSMQTNGVIGQYITIEADGTDIGIICGVQLADVSNNLATGGANNAPDFSIIGSVSATGVYTAAAQSCFRILDGTSVRFRPATTQDQYLGFVGAQSGTMRIYQSTNPGAGNY